MNTDTQNAAAVKPAIKTKRERNSGSSNPKKNPAARRVRDHSTEHKYVPRYTEKPKRDALGRPIPGRFVRYWGGRRPSKYDPVVESAKHAGKGAA